MDSWNAFFNDEKEKEYYKNLMKYIENEYATRVIFPPREKIFAAFEMTPFHRVRAVILGQDPYHEEGQAQGLAFSVPEGVKLPPSLRNIFKEVGQPGHQNGDLTCWAKNGVLLMNTVLTVRESNARSHANKGWEKFTDALIEWISENSSGVCFMLWGADAIAKETLISKKKHYVLKSSHPSPLSAHRGCGKSTGFMGSQCFKICKGLTGIEFNTANFMEI